MEARMINLKIDGQPCHFPQGTTILKACERLGIEIPTLCFLENICEEGTCGLCVVEVAGAKALQRACLTEIYENMEVFSSTPKALKARQMNLELLLAHHPLDCLTCEENGDCKVQDIAYQLGFKNSRFLRAEEVFSRKQETSWDTNPFIEFDPQKCVLCRRCVSACENQAMIEAIVIAQRGSKSRVSTPFNLPLEDATCAFCAECVQACPTGALIEKTRIGKGRVKDLTPTQTTCAYCGVGCSLRLFKDRKNTVVMVRAVEGPDTVNNGRICVKGRYGYEYVNSPERLTTPLVKRNGRFEKAGWEEAIQYTAKRLKEIKETYGPGAIGALGSSRCTNEDNYVLQKFARTALGTNNVDNCARLCHASTVVGLGKAFGAGAATNSFEDIQDSDVMLVIGSNMTETHPVTAKMVKEHRKKNGAKIIVCDPRFTDLAKYADIYLPHTPGTDVALLNGFMHLIMEEGLEKKEFIGAHTDGFEEFKKVIDEFSLDRVSQITGVDGDLIREAALLYGRARSAMIYYTMGITQHTTGVDNVLSIANLALLTGNIGRRGAGIMALRGQANVQGACDMGALPDVFPGYQKVMDPAAGEKFEKAYGVKLNNQVGMAVTEFADAALKGKLKAVYAMGENPVITEPDIAHVVEGFNKLDFFAVQEIFLSETAELADVVFPAAAAYEKDGTFTNTERRVQLLRPACEKPSQAKYDWEIVCAVSAAMGYPMEYQNSASIMEEIARVTPTYAGLRHSRLEKRGIPWPCPDEKHPGTIYLHKDGIFKRPNQKALLSAVDYKPAKELPDAEYPLILTTGRLLYHYHSGNETRRVKALDTFVPKNYVEINPRDAKKIKIKDGDKVRVTSRRGFIELDARISDKPKQGVVFISFHFREAAANVLTNPVFDPIAKIPEYKVAACRVEKIKK